MECSTPMKWVLSQRNRRLQTVSASGGVERAPDEAKRLPSAGNPGQPAAISLSGHTRGRISHLPLHFGRVRRTCLHTHRGFVSKNGSNTRPRGACPQVLALIFSRPLIGCNFGRSNQSVQPEMSQTDGQSKRNFFKWKVRQGSSVRFLQSAPCVSLEGAPFALQVEFSGSSHILFVPRCFSC